MKDFLAKYKLSTHSIAAAFATGYTLYMGVPEFQAFISKTAHKLPASVVEVFGVILALWLHYRNGEKQTNELP